MSRGLVEIIGSIFAGKRRPEVPPAGVEIKHPGTGEFASIYSRNPHSSILASVLTSPKGPATPDSGTIGAAPTNDNRPAAPASEKVGIGNQLRIARETVLADGEKLAALSDAHVSAYITQLLAMVEDQHCSIAFVGQMNAGKSSLINAFIGAPKFLPTEITPWTTVVTNLYFGIPKLPTGGALFEFFNKTEWQQLAEGSVRVRSLTERLVPNFPWEDFYRQVGNMREKAEEKLGARYGELLGSQHAMPDVTPEILEKYIAAESPLGDLDEGSAGEFSMITKAAHLYFELSSFFYPTVVIDTPGVNDPFLVRDEITRQNLERANVFVIVVTARQPLSNADLDLLRILRGLKKDNIIIFVNKVDEFDEFDAHASTIVDRIRGLLKKEFPASDIPIIMGSALWAEIALGEDLDEKRELAEEADIGVSRAPSMEGQAGGFWLSDPSVENTMLTDSILMRSGIADLALAVSEMLRTGTIANSITYSAAVLAALARNGSARASANSEIAGHLAGDGAAEAVTAETLTAKLERAGAVLSDIDSKIAAMEAGFDAVLRDHSSALLERLSGKVAAGIDTLGSAADAKPASPGSVQLSALVVRLRSELEQEFLALFQDALHQITARSQETEQALREQLALAAEVLGIGVEYPDLPALKSSPSLAALGEPVATDLGGVIHGDWGAKPLSSPERADEMRGFIVAEFEAIVGKLAKSAQAELSRTSAFILDHMRVTVARALKAIIDEQQALLGRSAPETDASGAMAMEAEIERERAKRFAVLAESVATASVSH